MTSAQYFKEMRDNEVVLQNKLGIAKSCYEGTDTQRRYAILNKEFEFSDCDTPQQTLPMGPQAFSLANTGKKALAECQKGTVVLKRFTNHDGGLMVGFAKCGITYTASAAETREMAALIASLAEEA